MRQSFHIGHTAREEEVFFVTGQQTPGEIMNKARSASETRGMLGQNLKTLMGEHGNVAELSRTLDINRTQMNRFLSGESFPRPDILKRICDHFGVDGRILLEPVESIITRKAGLRQSLALYGNGYNYHASSRLADGFYIFWKITYGRPARAQSILTQVKTIEGIKTFSGYMPKASGTYFMPSDPRERRSGGIIFPQQDGFSMLALDTHSRRLSLSFMEYCYMSRLFVGASYLSAGGTANTVPYVPVVMQQLPRNTGATLSAARECRLQPIEDVPDAIRELLLASPVHT